MTLDSFAKFLSEQHMDDMFVTMILDDKKIWKGKVKDLKDYKSTDTYYVAEFYNDPRDARDISILKRNKIIKVI